MEGGRPPALRAWLVGLHLPTVLGCSCRHSSATASRPQGNHDNLVACGDAEASPSKALVAQVYRRFFDAKVRPFENV